MTDVLRKAALRFGGTVVELLLDAARVGGARPALACGDVRLDYAGYAAAVLSLAAELRSDGGDPSIWQKVDNHDPTPPCIATALPNGINACIAHFGVLASGAQLLPLNADYTPRELERLLVDARPARLIADRSLQASLQPVVEQLGISTLWVDDGAAGLAERAASSVEVPGWQVLPADLALLQYTGGTSGRSKGVDLTHAAVRANIEQREATLPTALDSERILCVMPLFHAYGIAMGLYLAVRSRGALVILPSYRREQVLTTMASERITIFPGSPTIFIGLMEHAGFAGADWSALRTCYSGASALPVSVLERWEHAVGVPIYEGYGQTEAGPVLSYNSPLHGRKAGSVGRALSRTQIEIVDLNTGGEVLPANTRGEIRARGPQLMVGYRNLPAETQEALRDGWLYTGDIGEIDDDGYLFIRDRKKDLVIVGGYNVYPREVEDALMEHPDVLEAAVVGVPDPYRGQVLHAFVTLGADRSSTPSVAALHAHCATTLVKYKRPGHIVVIDQLPRTAANKTDKKALLAGVQPE